MKLYSILMSQAIRFMRVTNPLGGVYMPDAINAFKERYKFLHVPTVLAEYDPVKGVTFLHGKFLIKETSTSKGKVFEEIVIDKFQVYSNGILVETRATSEDTDLFLDDVIKWSGERFGYTVLPHPPVRRTYLSQIEVEFHELQSPPNPFTQKIEGYLREYGQAVQSWEVSGVTYHCDTSQMVAPVPVPFSIARREGMSYSSNIYFSSAPLTTAHHLSILQDIEAVAVERSKKLSKS